MNQRQYPHRFAVDLIHQAIAFVRDQLAGPGNLSRLAQQGSSQKTENKAR